eukprot:4121654-Alexandrium_andersonii.AAC.1
MQLAVFQAMIRCREDPLRKFRLRSNDIHPRAPRYTAEAAEDVIELRRYQKFELSRPDRLSIVGVLMDFFMS